MNIRILHVYPDLMSLYGSYANLTVLRRHLEELGNTVTVEPVLPGAEVADLTDVDFVYVGAGTERAQKAALADLRRYSDVIRAAAEAGVTMLFAGNAMELLGKSITDEAGTVFDGLGLAQFTSVQRSRRFVEDVYGTTDLYDEPVVGFMNKCSVTEGVEHPLLTALDMGVGNEGVKTPEGYHEHNVFASQLTGPLLVKNPRMLDAVMAAIYGHRGETLPEQRPAYRYEEEAYAVTEAALKERCGKA